MKLILSGADCRYSVEQIAITLFPDERHSWDAALPGLADCRVTTGAHWRTASVTITRGGLMTHGFAHAVPDADAYRDGALVRFIVRRAFYRATLPHLAEVPPWGALSGVRPAKLGRALIAETGSPERAVRVLEKNDFLRHDKALLTVRCAVEALHVLETRGPRDAEVYIGIPFCPTRCAYCSFVSSTTAAEGELVEPYVDALCRELADGAERVKRLSLRVRSLYMGGGTPTTLSPAQLDRVLTAAYALGGPDELTVEAGRPDTITPEKLAVLRAHGVGRVSVNPQTMNDAVLRTIGRRHTAEDVLRAMDMVRNAGFSCVNMDLIAGLPGDTADSFRDTLDRILALHPENITVHTFAHKKGAALFDAPSIPAQALSEMLSYVERTLSPRYQPYYLYRQKYIGGSFENIGWTLPGYPCAYNIAMMEETSTVLAFGAGAVTKFVAPGLLKRLPNPKYAREYLRDFDAHLSRKTALDALYAKY
ncbi:MAG: coproporphyrinogen dehydrogenase HemZ [Clostridiaceae bacterium]|nr:coproporphyrinogen dehydrogenase HemZ [Clostridiaceae bacterium]